MPIYEYRCEACGEDTEVFHRKMGEDAPECPSCGEDALERLVSRTSFKLKGGGWYVTDYKSGGGASKEASGDTASEGGGAASESGGGAASEGGGGSSDGGGSGGNGEAVA